MSQMNQSVCHCPALTSFQRPIAILFVLGLCMGTNASPVNSGSCALSQRSFNFVNNCNETIWIGATGLAAPSGWELRAHCTSDADCSQDQTCNAKTQQCQLTVCADESFSGRFWPRTGCDFNATGVCESGHNCCATGGCTGNRGWGLECTGGGQSPLTTAEFTVSQTKPDFYDVSVIDGFNVGIEIQPIGDIRSCPFQTKEQCDYWCGNPGGTTSKTGLEVCKWDAVLNKANHCHGHPELRVVEPSSCQRDSDCASGHCNLGTNVCVCTDDNGCGDDEVCGVGNNEIIGYRTCGKFVGCTTGKALCGIGAYFNHGKKGDPCSKGSDCASNTCQNNKCTQSPIDELDCNKMYPRTAQCSKAEHCPALVGMKFDDRKSCTCPSGTVCDQIGDNQGKPIFGCRETCSNGKCIGAACTSNDDCTTFNKKSTGTFLLCDTSSKNSPTYQRCVSTNASLYSATGNNGQSCYSDDDDVTSLCAGCPTETDHEQHGVWPTPTASCRSNNPDWAQAIRPSLSSFKSACPTAYSFPFDDPTSTFQCQGKGADVVGYTITFCPA
eukprot:Clim_evm11s98 gene=Clim_evmTU11s98